MTPSTFPCENKCGAMCRERKGRKTRLCSLCNARANGVKMRVRCDDPDWVAALGRKISATRRDRMECDPEFRDRQREAGSALGRLGLGMQQYGKGHPRRMAAGASISAAKLRWCAPAYRPLYRQLRRGKNLLAAEGRAATIEQFEREKNRFLNGILQDPETFKRVRESLGYEWGAAA